MNPNNVAVPPPPNFAFERGRANSTGYARLRAASEMRRQGIISEEEKAKIKELIMQKDEAFREQFDKAQRTGDLSTIRKLLQSLDTQPWAQDAVLTDINDLTLGDDDLSFLEAFHDSDFLGLGGRPQPQHAQHSQHPHQHHQQHRQSIGFGSEFGMIAVPPSGGKGPDTNPAENGMPVYTRKRQASRSMPSPGLTKVMAPSQSQAMYGTVGHVRRSSRPLDIHSSMFRNAISREPANVQQRSSHPSTAPAAVKIERRPFTPNYGQQVDRVQMENKDMQDISRQMDGNAYSHLYEDGEDETGRLAKSRKNERERKRRLAVTQGFDELYKLLKEMDDDGGQKLPGQSSILSNPKPDKASILKNSIEKIQSLEHQVHMLSKENVRLKQLIDAKRGKPQ